MYHTRGLFVVATLAAALCGTPAFTQQQKAAPKPDTKINDVVITLHGAQGPLVQAEWDGKPWIMQVEAKAKIELTGTAELDYITLAKGPLLARVRTEVNTRQKVSTNPVSEVELVIMSDANIPGVSTDSGIASFGDSQPKPNNNPVQNAAVTGLVTGYKNGVAVINGYKITIDPAAKVKVNFDAAGAFQALPPGTKVNVNLAYFEKLPGRALITGAKMEFAEPLAIPQPKRPGGKGGPAAKSEDKEKTMKEPAKDAAKEKEMTKEPAKAAKE
ncbi:MAG: hypothetical protein QM811_07610 [Pirellulales bacterium]